MDKLVQENKDLTSISQHLKTTTYEYDLVSGNVNAVHYQDGIADQFHHRYWYDADNRLSNVWTSLDKVVWKQDAKYFFNLHGPLGRTEIGHEKVQGLDYAYTINGWLKGVNANTLVRSQDLGKDGVDDGGTGTFLPSKPDIHLNTGIDAFGFTLHYFTGDWTPINSSATSMLADISALDNTGDNLYNGNIKQMATALMKPNGTNLPVTLGLISTRYHYDQLNRIRSNNAYLTASTTAYTGATNNNDYQETFTYDANGNILTLNRNGTGTPQAMDQLTYNYTSGTNKLTHVADAVAAGNYAVDIDNQTAGNYGYDAIGNMVSDGQEQIQTITWSVYGQVLTITRAASSTKDDLEFTYDAMGNRVCKIVKPRPGGNPSSASDWIYTYYARDAQGNVLCVYKKSEPGGITEFRVKEQHIYGSSRIGMRLRNIDMLNLPAATAYLSDTLGRKDYELTNHLGNVLVVVTDRKLSFDLVADGTTDYYFGDVISTSDYYAFGMLMVGRNYSSTAYRYGFQKQERDQEYWSGSIVFKYRTEDPRLGRFFSADPVEMKYPWNSPYSFSENKVISAIEWEGLESVSLFDNSGGGGGGLAIPLPALTAEAAKLVTQAIVRQTAKSILQGVLIGATAIVTYKELSDLYWNNGLWHGTEHIDLRDLANKFKNMTDPEFDPLPPDLNRVVKILTAGLLISKLLYENDQYVKDLNQIEEYLKKIENPDRRKEFENLQRSMEERQKEIQQTLDNLEKYRESINDKIKSEMKTRTVIIPVIKQDNTKRPPPTMPREPR